MTDAATVRSAVAVLAALLTVTGCAAAGLGAGPSKPTPKPAVTGRVTATTSGDCKPGATTCPQTYLSVRDGKGNPHTIPASAAVAERCLGHNYPACLKDGGHK